MKILENTFPVCSSPFILIAVGRKVRGAIIKSAKGRIGKHLLENIFF